MDKRPAFCLPACPGRSRCKWGEGCEKALLLLPPLLQAQCRGNEHCDLGLWLPLMGNCLGPWGWEGPELEWHSFCRAPLPGSTVQGLLCPSLPQAVLFLLTGAHSRWICPVRSHRSSQRGTNWERHSRLRGACRRVCSSWRRAFFILAGLPPACVTQSPRPSSGHLRACVCVPAPV